MSQDTPIPPFVRILPKELREDILSQTDLRQNYNPPDLFCKVGPDDSWRKFEEGWGPYTRWEYHWGVNSNWRPFEDPLKNKTYIDIDEEIKDRRAHLASGRHQLQILEREVIEIEQMLQTTTDEPTIHELLFSKAYTVQGIYYWKKKMEYMKNILEHRKLYRSLSKAR